MAVVIVPVEADDVFLAGVVAAVPVEEALASFLVRAYVVILEVALAEALGVALVEALAVALGVALAEALGVALAEALAVALVKPLAVALVEALAEALVEALAVVLVEQFVVAYFAGMAYFVEGVGHLLKQTDVLTLAVQRWKIGL